MDSNGEQSPIPSEDYDINISHAVIKETVNLVNKKLYQRIDDQKAYIQNKDILIGSQRQNIAILN